MVGWIGLAIWQIQIFASGVRFAGLLWDRTVWICLADRTGSVFSRGNGGVGSCPMEHRSDIPLPDYCDLHIDIRHSGRAGQLSYSFGRRDRLEGIPCSASCQREFIYRYCLAQRRDLGDLAFSGHPLCGLQRWANASLVRYYFFHGLRTGNQFSNGVAAAQVGQPVVSGALACQP